MIYVICPPNLITGGPDALHQLVYYLNKNGIEAKIVYSRLKRKNYIIPITYSCYVNDYLLLDDIVDSENNICIVPETLIFYLNKYTKIKKYIWWLSVDNNKISINNKIKKMINKMKNFGKAIQRKDFLGRIKEFILNKKYDFTNENLVAHLCASHYAFDYVSKRTSQKCVLFIEPISLSFLSSMLNYSSNLYRKKRVLYNPAKNYEFSRKIIKRMKDVSFIPLKGFNQKDLITLFRENMIYMDFGSFPGAERLPKEAVVNGCLIITGKNGASKFHSDVPILEKYKFDVSKDNIDSICDMIRYMLDNYDALYSDFDEYRQMVLSLEKNFIIQIIEIFGG